MYKKDQKKLICLAHLWDLGNCDNQNTMNLSKNVLFEVSFNENQ